MREIKFGAFSSKSGMWSWDKLKGNYPEPHPLSCLYSHDGWNVMQFTGLKDKNGKEIYEGDIFHMGDLTILYVCDFDNGYFGGRQTTNKSRVGLAYWQDQIEIIGNMYETPELLKQRR